MGEWIMETILGDFVGTTIGIHSTVPYEAPDSSGWSVLRLGLGGLRVASSWLCRMQQGAVRMHSGVFSWRTLNPKRAKP